MRIYKYNIILLYGKRVDLNINNWMTGCRINMRFHVLRSQNLNSTRLVSYTLI